MTPPEKPNPAPFTTEVATPRVRVRQPTASLPPGIVPPRQGVRLPPASEARSTNVSSTEAADAVAAAPPQTPNARKQVAPIAPQAYDGPSLWKADVDENDGANARSSISTRFQPGNNANPKGRPKGSKNARTILIAALDTPIVVTVNGRQRKMSKMEVGAIKFANKFAETGNAKTLLDILKIIYPHGVTIAEAVNAVPPISDEAAKLMLERYVEKRVAKARAKPDDDLSTVTLPSNLDGDVDE